MFPIAAPRGAMTDLIGGQVQLMFDTTAASIPHIKGGKVRALAVTTATRSALLPDLPMVADFVPGYEASGPFGLGAPKDTPPAVIEKLNKEINAVLADPKVKARLGGARQRAAHRHAGRDRPDAGRRNREVGQGDQGRQHQGGMTSSVF